MLETILDILMSETVLYAFMAASAYFLWKSPTALGKKTLIINIIIFGALVITPRDFGAAVRIASLAYVVTLVRAWGIVSKNSG